MCDCVSLQSLFIDVEVSALQPHSESDELEITDIAKMVYGENKRDALFIK